MNALAAAAFPPFRTRDLLGLLRGTPVYRYRDFYEVKNALLRYDDRDDYLNYGYWRDGAATMNPSAALVELVADRLELGADDVLLDLGCGLGQPDVDIARRSSVRRIVGVNVNEEQVRHASARFGELGLASRIEHRVCPAQEIASRCARDGITAVVSIEALAEMPGIERVIAGAFSLLPRGGRIAFCDVVSEPASGRGLAPRALGAALMRTTTALYGDHWRSIDAYARLLRGAGFTGIEVERIGARVYRETYDQARARFAALRARRDLPAIAKALAYANLKSLAMLHAWGRVDYAVFLARRE